MKRLAIFAIYDKDGYVDESSFFLLEQIKKVSRDTIIVVNGCIQRRFLDRLQMLVSVVYVRENNGLDAGAYAEVIVDLVGKEKLSKYDEMILCNDTFLGPLQPLEHIFNKMEKKKVDFWGIDWIRRDFLSYIIMYFCVFRNKMLSSGELYDYFSEKIYGQIRDVHDAFARFEVGLFYNMSKLGYLSGVYTYTNGTRSQIEPLKCVKKYGLPIIKKKFFLPENFEENQYRELIEQVSLQGFYNIEFIRECKNRKYSCNDVKIKKEIIERKYSIPDVQESQLSEFLRLHSSIYIYGCGSFGKAIRFVFADRIQNFEGYIVSNKVRLGELDELNVVSFGEQKKHSGIIVALNKKNSIEVQKQLEQCENEVIYLWATIL